MTTRRQHLRSLGHLWGALVALPTLMAATTAQAARIYDLLISEAEWKKRLSPEQFAVLRRKQTERPYSSPLNKESRAGLYRCAGCDLALFSSTTKFDAGTGWPSFGTLVTPGAVYEDATTAFGLTETEVVCRRCGGYLGHVYEDSPQPDGRRYSVSGAALSFVPA